MNAKQHDNIPTQFIAIGDIHGCLEPLKRLIDALKPASTDQLVFLGDYVDRGPDSKGVIDFLLELRQSVNCVFLSGNHEVLMLDYFAWGNTLQQDWARNGGDSTLDSYLQGGEIAIPESHIAFLNDCLPYYETPEYFFVHGGVKPYRTIEENLRVMRLRDFVWERSHMDSEVISANNFKWEKTVVCGHTPLPSPVLLEKLIAIDTGCVYNHTPRLGRLTAIALPDRRIIQADNRQSAASPSMSQRILSFFKK
jgi:serine/threonine protein phosphatase 1